MKLNQIITLVVIVATLLFVGCSGQEEPQIKDSNDNIASEDEENNQIEDSSSDEEVVEYFEAKDEEIDLGELI